MPHLQFKINKKIENSTKISFISKIEEAFAEVMDTSRDHITISIKEYNTYNLSIGRTKSGDIVCLMDLDIREGRSLEQRRTLALRFMSIVNEEFKIDNRNQYITFTEHKGEDFHLIEKYLASWKKGEDPLA